MSQPERFLESAENAEKQSRYEDAFRYLLAGAMAGHAGCQINLGNYYTEGKGTARDKVLGRSWYERAYNSGDRTGAHNLGIDYRNESDFEQASRWLRKAADLNDGDACVDLAELCLESEERTALLKKALTLSPVDISEDARERAAELLAGRR